MNRSAQIVLSEWRDVNRIMALKFYHRVNLGFIGYKCSTASKMGNLTAVAHSERLFQIPSH